MPSAAIVNAGFVVLAAVIAYLAIHTASLGKALRAVTQNLEGVTARRDTLDARLEQLEAEHNTLMAQCGIGILVLTPDGLVERANATAAEYFGTRPSAMAGKKVLAATLSNELQESFEQVGSVGRLTREIIARGGGAEYHLHVTIAPIDHPIAERRRVLVIAQDVSDLRRLEIVRRDFVANVSHELRTPLTSIRAAAETLQQCPPNDRAFIDRFTEMIVSESERLTRISDDLLVLSSAELTEPAKGALDLSELIQGVINRVSSQASKRNVALVNDVPAGLSLMANGDQLEQVIWNLLDNAIKYTQQGGNVTVSGHNLGSNIEVAVRDTGIGILQQDLPRIFERFYRVDKARSRETGGTGLGLSIVKHIVEAHGGKVSVESEYNRGSTFTILLPCV